MICYSNPKLRPLLILLCVSHASMHRPLQELDGLFGHPLREVLGHVRLLHHLVPSHQEAVEVGEREQPQDKQSYCSKQHRPQTQSECAGEENQSCGVKEEQCSECGAQRSVGNVGSDVVQDRAVA